MKCVICRDAEASQKHHVCYDPEILVEVCISCHKVLHKNKHGVGKGRGYLRKEEQKRPYIKSLLTREVVDESNVSRIYSVSTEELLMWLTCPNTKVGCSGGGFRIFAEMSTRRVYLRCKKCGFDFEVILEDAHIGDENYTQK